MELRVKDGEQHIHEQEETETQVEDEEEAVDASHLVGWEHEVGEVGRGHQHEDAVS